MNPLKKGFAPASIAVLGASDNPHKDGPGQRQNVRAGGGKERFIFPGTIELVISEEVGILI